MGSTNYFETFITVADDCPAQVGTGRPGGVERLSGARPRFSMTAAAPFRHTSDAVIFGVTAERQGIPKAERPAARAAFFAKPQACLRASDLGRRYGWGIHSDAHGRVALYGVETEEYRRLAAGESLAGEAGAVTVITRAMRSKRAR